MRSFFLGILLISLVGCSSDPQQPSVGLDLLNIGLAKIRSAGKGQYTPTADEIRASATPAALAQIGKPVMLAELPGAGIADILIFIQQNEDYTTWVSSDGVTFTFKNGLLTGTRGMGRDLMTSDVDQVLRGINIGAGDGVRVNRYLDGDQQLVLVAFFCRYRRLQNGVISENCNSRQYAFENQYWLGRDGQIIKSRQWIGPERGYLISERLS